MTVASLDLSVYIINTAKSGRFIFLGVITRIIKVQVVSALLLFFSNKGFDNPERKHTIHSLKNPVV